jgi:hyperosmotically inducible protein
MKVFTYSIASIAAGCIVSISGCDSRQNTPPASTSSTSSTSSTTSGSASRAPADNTGRNEGDLARDARTPMDQSQSSEHIKLTADIRRAVMADDTLSTGAKNCKIITDSTGRVWLRGVVYSQNEKSLIESKATQIAGVNNVTNELEIKRD